MMGMAPRWVSTAGYYVALSINVESSSFVRGAAAGAYASVVRRQRARSFPDL